jgi:hypothetical protein
LERLHEREQQKLEDAHDAEIEIGEGPEPPAREGPVY